MEVRQRQLLEQRRQLREVGIVFARETHDDVGPDSGVRAAPF